MRRAFLSLARRLYDENERQLLTSNSRAVIIATVGQAVAGHAPAISIIGVLVFWRFIMGIGIGGDYPLSATITSEFAATRIRGRSASRLLKSPAHGPCSR